MSEDVPAGWWIFSLIGGLTPLLAVTFISIAQEVSRGNPNSEEHIRAEDEPLGEYLDRMRELWDGLTPKAARYVGTTPFYEDFARAMGYQLEHGKGVDPEVFKAWLDESVESHSKHWFYYVPEKDYSIRFDYETIEKMLRWWSDPENVIRAELTIQELNKQINKMMRYGLRGHLVEKPGYILMWSNELATWRINHHRYVPGEEAKLNSNEVYAPYDDYDLLWMIKDHLDVLPLYFASIEAKQRKHIPWDEATRLWATIQEIRIEEEKELEKYA